MVSFSTKQILPISEKEVRYTPLINKDYIELLKYSINNDLSGYNDALESILRTCCVDYTVLESNLDKFLVLLDIRSLSLGDEIILNANTTEVKYSITGIRKKISSYYSNLYKECKLESWFLEGLPKDLYHNSDEELETELLFRILNIPMGSKEEQKQAYYNLPSYMLPSVRKTIQKVHEFSSKINIIEEKESLGIEKVDASLINNNMFMFIKAIFDDNLLSMYELEYNLTTKLNMSYDRFINLTPNESKIFIGMYNKERKEQEEAQKKSNSFANYR